MVAADEAAGVREPSRPVGVGVTLESGVKKSGFVHTSAITGEALESARETCWPAAVADGEAPREVKSGAEPLPPADRGRLPLTEAVSNSLE